MKSTAEAAGSISKAFEVLRAFVDAQDKWGVRELASGLDLPRSTVHRMLATLRDYGILDYRDMERKYQLGSEFFRLASAGSRRNEYMRAAIPLLRDLSRDCGEDAWFALYDASKARVVYSSEQVSSQLMRPHVPNGHEQSLTEGAAGIAVLAMLDEPSRRRAMRLAGTSSVLDIEGEIAKVRKQGYSVLKDEELDAVVIAAAAGDASGNPVGSLVVVVPAHDDSAKRRKPIGKLVASTALRITERLSTRFLGGARSGSWSTSGAIISEMLQDQNLELSMMLSPGGAVSNLDKLGRGLASYALTTEGSLQAASARTKRNSENVVSNLRTVMRLFERHLHIVTRPGIRIDGVTDLVDLRICAGRADHSSVLVLEQLLAVAGVKLSQIERKGLLLDLEFSEALRQLQAGSIDVLLWLGVKGLEFAKSVEKMPGTTLVRLSDSVLQSMIEANPGYAVGTLAPTLYPLWLGAPLRTLVDPTVLVCSQKRPAEEVYDVTKTLFEGRARLTQKLAAYRRLDADFAASAPTVPLHPGASRFFDGIVTR